MTRALPQKKKESVLEAALSYAEQGFHVLPVRRQSKVPANSNGKDGATTDADVIKRAFARPGLNIGIRTGASCGIAVFDVDPRNGGNESFIEIEKTYGPLPDTLTASTHGGTHRYYQLPLGCPPLGDKPGLGGYDGIDLKCDGYVVAAPSMHPEGSQYAWTTDAGSTAPIAVLPQFIIDLYYKRKAVQASGQDNCNSILPDGQRNDGLFRRGSRYRGQGMDLAAIKVLLTNDNLTLCTTPLDQSEVDAIAASVMRYDANETVALTDLANSRRLVELAAGNLLYARDIDSWFGWDGQSWQRDAGDAAMTFAIAVADGLAEAAKLNPDPENRAKAVKVAKTAQKLASLKAMVELAKHHDDVKVMFNSFDRELHLLNVHNGTIDLRSATLHPLDRDQRITKLIPIAFLPDATCPVFVRTTRQIFEDDEEMVAYFQTVVGYSATGDCREQCLFVCHGRGANGKTTLMDALGRVFGPYACHTPTETLIATKAGRSASNDLARLVGSRFVTASEANADDKLAIGLVKQMTGGEPIAARFLFKEFFEFTPTFKIFLATNCLPRLDATDAAIMRRIRTIPFDRVFAANEQDRTLAEQFSAEAEGILAWIVEGARRWYDAGSLMTPTKVTAANEAYRVEMDSIGAFLSETYEEDPSASVSASSLHTDYRLWTKSNGLDPVSQTAFGISLTNRGYAARKGSGGLSLRRGLKARNVLAGWIKSPV